MEHQVEVLTRRVQFDLDKAEARAHIVEGLLIAQASIDEVIEVIKKSKDPEIALASLMARFRLTELQAKAILVMQLQRITGLEVDKLKEEYAELKKNIQEFQSILKSHEKKLEIIVKDFKEVVNSVGLFNFAQGHSNAFGCEISSDKLDAARKALNKALENYEYDDTIYCDFILDVYDMDYEFIKTIDDYKWVWGQQVEEPIVAIENIEISTDDCMVMGKNQDTVAFMYGGVKYCKFKCSEGDELLIFARGLSDEYATLNVVGKCSINEYKGNYTPQVIIDDYEFTI